MNRYAMLCTLACLLAAAPARAQFAPSSGAGAGLPSLSGAGTGLSAPSTIRSGGAAMTDPNAIPGLAPAPVPAAPSLLAPDGMIGPGGLPPGDPARRRAAAQAASRAAAARSQPAPR